MIAQEAVAHDVDSHTPTSPNKRHRDDTSLSSLSRSNTTQSTPRKRVKLDEDHDLKRLIDFIPTVPTLVTVGDGDREADSVSDVSVSDQESLGWLSPPKQPPQKQTPYRSGKSKKRNSARNSLPINFDLPVAEKASQIPGYRSLIIGATRVDNYFNLAVKENTAYFGCFVRAFEAVQGSRKTLRNAIKKDKNNKDSIRQQLHKAEVNLAWCQYYPLQYKWHPFPSPKKSKNKKESNELQRVRKRFWNLVERSMSEGTLLDLRVGKFGGVDDCQEVEFEAQHKEIAEAQERYQREMLQIQQIELGHHQKPMSIESWDALVRRAHLASVDLNYCQFYPRNRDYQPLMSWRQYGSELTQAEKSSKLHPAQLWRIVERCMKTNRLQELKDGRVGGVPKLSNVLLPDGELPSPEMTDVSATNAVVAMERQSRDSNVSARASSPSQNGSGDLLANTDRVVTNVGFDAAYDKPRPGETTESDEDRGSDHSGQAAGSDDEEHYADSVSLTQKDRAQHHSPQAVTMPGARILSELSPEDLNSQLRYFHFGLPKSLNNAPMNAEVRCLSCAQPGHMAPDCESLTCSGCGAYNKHVAADCHTIAKCGKCRETGHKELACPYKLKNLARREVICNLCRQNGHYENECELFWRSSGCPWRSDISIKDIRAFCYECGQPGHLGNDCLSRQPGKTMGTSTWSLQNIGPTPTVFDEISIRGRANQQPSPYNQPYQDSESSNFHRPKPPQPSRKGQIKINVGNSKTIEHLPPPTWTPINDRDQNNRRPPSRYETYRGAQKDRYQDFRSDNRPLPVQSYPPPSYRTPYENPPLSTYNQYGYHPHPPLPPPGQQYNTHHNHPPPQMGQYQVQHPPPPGLPDTYRPMPGTSNRGRY